MSDSQQTCLHRGCWTVLRSLLMVFLCTQSKSHWMSWWERQESLPNAVPHPCLMQLFYEQLLRGCIGNNALSNSDGITILPGPRILS